MSRARVGVMVSFYFAVVLCNFFSQLYALRIVQMRNYLHTWPLDTCCHCVNPSAPLCGVSGRRHLCSADNGYLHFPRVILAAYGSHAIAYTGPTIWNSLPFNLTDSNLSLDLQMPSKIFCSTGIIRVSEVCYKICAI